MDGFLSAADLSIFDEGHLTARKNTREARSEYTHVCSHSREVDKVLSNTLLNFSTYPPSTQPHTPRQLLHLGRRRPALHDFSFFFISSTALVYHGRAARFYSSRVYAQPVSTFDDIRRNDLAAVQLRVLAEERKANNWAQTSLMCALDNRQPTIALWLLKHRGQHDLETADDDGWTALH